MPTIIRILLVIVCGYMAKLALFEYVSVKWLDKPATHPFSFLEQVSVQVNGPVQQVAYEQQLLYIGGAAMAVLMLLIITWFIRKLYVAAVVSAVLFLLAMVWKHFTA